MTTANNYPAQQYKAISTSNLTFKQPRQKVWGVFSIDPDASSNGKDWKLISSSTDFDDAKKIYNQWLNNPEDPTSTHTGVNSIILAELLPSDSFTVY